MSHNINELKAEFGAGARPTQFFISVTNPINPSADRQMQFHTKAGQLPASTIGIIELGYYGRKVKIPGDRTYAEWTTTIRNDEDFALRDKLEEWVNAINAPERNIATRGSNPNTYKSQGTAIQYSIDGTELRTYQLNGLWPSDLAAIELDWDSNDQVEEFQVTWQFDSFEVVGGITGNAGGR